MTVIATSNNIVQTFQITVVGNAALSTLSILGGSSTVASGAYTPAFTSTGFDQYGNTVSPTPTVSWSCGSTGDTGTAAIDSNSGILQGQKDGTVTVTATSGSITKTQTITVQGYGTVVTLTIANGASTVLSGANTPAFTTSGVDQYGNIGSISPFWSTFAIGDTGTAVIDKNTGVLTGQKAGIVTVIASSSTCASA